MVIEVMGRDARGWIALHSGIAGGADVILIPEIPFTIETVCKKPSRAGRRRKEILAGGRGGRGEVALLVMPTANRFPAPRPGQKWEF